MRLKLPPLILISMDWLSIQDRVKVGEMKLNSTSRIDSGNVLLMVPFEERVEILGVC